MSTWLRSNRARSGLRSGAFESKSEITIRVQVTWSVQSLSIASWIATTLAVLGIVIGADASFLAAAGASSAMTRPRARNTAARRALPVELELTLIDRTSWWTGRVGRRSVYAQGSFLPAARRR